MKALSVILILSLIIQVELRQWDVQCGNGSASHIYQNLFPESLGNHWPHNRIIGSTHVSTGDFPWAVYLEQVNSNEKVCTGTVISKNYILTAKHCTVGVNEIIVKYGNAEIAQMETQIATKFIQTTGNNTFGEDIALIRLENPIEFNHGVNPICLSRSLTPKIVDKAVVAGFGLIFKKLIIPVKKDRPISSNYLDTEPATELHSASIDIIDIANCHCNCSDPSEDPKENNEFCAGGLQQGTLKGDSGGPLMVLHKKLWYQIGITSRGTTFATDELDKIINYGTYIDVSKFCDWIEQSTNNEVACVP